MWITTTIGFFSVVQWVGEERLTIRARVKADLEALRDRYLPGMGEIEEFAGTDYEYRAKASKQDFAMAFAEIVLGIDYSNFKSAVTREQGAARAHVYHKVWADLQDLSPNTRDYYWRKRGHSFMSDPFWDTIDEPWFFDGEEGWPEGEEEAQTEEEDPWISAPPWMGRRIPSLEPYRNKGVLR